MTFSDDDLKRLKERFSKYKGSMLSPEEGRTLLARTEAAEACAGLLGTFPNLKVDAQYLLSEWRKAAGKS